MKLKTHTQSPLAESAEAPSLTPKRSLLKKTERKAVGPRNCVPSNVGVIKRHKHGDTREDGRVFYRYTPHCVNGEQWVKKKQFDRYRKNVTTQRSENLNKNQAYQREWRAKNKEKSREHTEKWRSKNPTYFTELAKKKRSGNPLFDLKGRLRSRIYLALRKNNASKRTQDILGATIKEVFYFLEAQFLIGMSWGNRKDWHIDHIVPLACAATKEEMRALCHHSNLRPIWKLDNLIKSAKIPNEIPQNVHYSIQKIWQRHQNEKQ